MKEDDDVNLTKSLVAGVCLGTLIWLLTLGCGWALYRHFAAGGGR